MTFAQRRDLAQRLRAIPLERVLPLCGAQPDRDDRRKWHTPAGMLSVTGAKFMNWTWGRAVAGPSTWSSTPPPGLQRRRGLAGGPLSGSPAARSLCAPLARLAATAPTTGPRPTGTRQRLPDRATPPALRLVAPLIDSGTLYADARANAVFLLRDDKTNPSAPSFAAPPNGLGTAWPPAPKKTWAASPFPPEPPANGRPLRIGHRRHQLLRPPSRLPVPLHRRRPPQPTLAPAPAGPRLPDLLRLRRRSHR